MANLISLKPKKASACKGLVFRCHVTVYRTGGGYSEQLKMTPLKRQSCSGCGNCGGMLEWLEQEVMDGCAPIIKGDPEDGAMYLLTGQGGGGPDHNGEYDSGEIVMVKV